MKKFTYKGRDEYPKTFAGAYELLIITSHQIGIYTHQSGQFIHLDTGSGRSDIIFLIKWRTKGDIGGCGDYGNNATCTEDVWGKLASHTKESEVTPTKHAWMAKKQF